MPGNAGEARAVGVIAEYNPFHNGHARHLAEARKQSGARYAVAVMSGPVTQRGAFSRHGTFLRTRMALQGGADLVLLLPARFACAPAADFARGGIGLLAATGAVTHLSFGCEPEMMKWLRPVSGLLAEEPEPFRAALRRGLDAGLSFPQAQARACEETLSAPGLAERMRSPNFALALAYLLALPEGIRPVPVPRTGSAYGDPVLSALPSASAVRRALEEGRGDPALPGRLAGAVPFPEALLAAEAEGRVHPEDAMDRALLALLRCSSAEALSEISGMDEGLEHRFLEAARTAGTKDALLEAVKSRRYTRARLSRVSMNALLGVTKAFAAENAEPRYLRVLGFRRSARPLLHAIREASPLPLVVKCADYRADDPLFALDLLAEDLWALGCGNPEARAAGADFRESPVILDDGA